MFEVTDWKPGADRPALFRRARLYDDIRSFFRLRSVLEVDTPALSSAAVSDPHVESLVTRIDGVAGAHYLHTSPEFPMKRLLAAGSGDIYQICKVFRQAEIGRVHNPEFTLLEWYRIGFNHHDLMDEMDALLDHLVPEIENRPTLRITFHEAFLQYAGIDIEGDVESIRAGAIKCSHAVPEGITEKSDWLDWLMGQIVAQGLPRDRFTFIYDYPGSQAALARIRPGKPAIAERFEVYWGDLELANGFHELADADEQLARFRNECASRKVEVRHVPPVDERLIDALRHGLPDCAGVALGLDRLLMLCLGKTELKDVMTFAFDHA